MRFLHTADIHLDSPLKGLSRYEGAPVEALRGATREALKNLVTKAIDLQVDFLLIAGDLYDGDWPDYNTGLFFTKQMARLHEADIPVIVIRGNHDAQSRLTKGLKLPDNVTMLSVDAPETVILKELKVAIHGQGFKTQSVLDDLTERYPTPVSDHFNIGMLHTGLEGRPGHAHYAPSTLERLRSLGYDYWALGHIHKREVLCEDPYIVFCGNLQGRHARETGPKGATLVTLAHATITSVEHLPLDVVRWSVVEYDISKAETADEVVAGIGKAIEKRMGDLGGRILAARVVVVGRGPSHADLVGNQEYWMAEIRNLAVQLGHDSVWIEKIKFESSAVIELESMAEQHDAFASLLQGLDKLKQSDEDLESLRNSLFATLEQKLPLDWKTSDVERPPTSLEAVREALDDVAHILATRLSNQRGDSQ